jgi:predicted Zn-dependent protease
MEERMMLDHPRRLPAAVSAACLFLAGIGLLVAAGCATNPVSGKREFSLVSSGQELQMGQEGYKAAVGEYGIYQEMPVLQAYVDSVGQRLAKVSHRPDLTWHFTLLDDPTVNAFAMPGGYIYITRGILAHLNSEAQLAGVLGHEIGHVTARHSARQITNQQLAGLGLGVAGVFSSTVRRYGELAQQGLQLMFLKYGRDDENQADQLGVEYATKAGWDPREIPATYTMLKRISDRAGQRLPSYLSTHPDPGDREARTTELARAAVAGKTGLIVSEVPYVRRLDGVLYGRDPRQGYFEGTQYLHPQLAIQLVFPAGWKTQDSRTSAMAGEPNQKAVMQVSLANAGTRSPTEMVQELKSSGKIADAAGKSETIGGFPAWLGKVAVAGEGGATSVLIAGFIRTAPDVMLQFLGQTTTSGDADEQKIFESVRSVRKLTDEARLHPEPARVKVTKVKTNTTFEAAVKSLEPATKDIEEVAILNNELVDQDVRIGETIKLIRPGHR